MHLSLLEIGAHSERYVGTLYELRCAVHTTHVAPMYAAEKLHAGEEADLSFKRFKFAVKTLRLVGFLVFWVYFSLHLGVCFQG